MIERPPLPLVARALSWVVFLAWMGGVMTRRFVGLFHEWSVDGDQFQAVFHYYRYHHDGYFPPGELFTDFAFVMHAPPLWWLMMASLSTFITPLAAAKLLNVIAYFVAISGMYVAVRSRSNHWIALFAAAVLVRDMNFHGIIAGGYARSFGPALIIWFLYFFLQQRHRACLLMLVLQAALYPSVVIPSGIAYGIYVLIKGPDWQQRRRRVIGMFVTGLIVLSFGFYQDIARPKWWGPIVTLEEALEMPAWHRGGGRFHDAPLTPKIKQLRRQATRSFTKTGHIWGPDVIARWNRSNYNAYPLIPAGLCLIVLGVLAVVRRVRGPRTDGARREPLEFPWQIFALIAAALVGWMIARALAFRLYMPYRVLSHGLPYVVIAGMSLLPFLTFKALLGRRGLATVLAIVVGFVPLFLIAGDGLGNERPTYGDFSPDEPTWKAIDSLPRQAIIAAPIWLADKIPLLAKHRVYSNKNLCQPFRKGLYAECERRLVRTYEALYATSLVDVVKFAVDEKVDYIVVDKGLYGPKVDGRIFHPARRKVRPAHQRGRASGFALQKTPEAAVVWRGPRHFIVDVTRLRAIVDVTAKVEEP